ncbi:MAG: hypothetical protein WA118_12945 [Carboxydocellales bacterium]
MGNISTPATKDGGRLAAESRTTNRRGLGAYISPPNLQLQGMELRAPNRGRHPTGDIRPESIRPQIGNQLYRPTGRTA